MSIRLRLENFVNCFGFLFLSAIFRSLLYEACGRIVNPIYGSVGLLWSGSWQLCQAAVEAVLKGAPITPITSEAAANGRGPPLKGYDIRHVSKDENSAATKERVKTRTRFKRTAAEAGCVTKPKDDKETRFGPVEPESEEVMDRSGSHESSLSHQSEVAANAVVEGESKESKESESEVSEEASILLHDEPESHAKVCDRADESADEVGLELTLGFEPVSRAHHMVPVKKRRFELFKDCSVSADESGSCKMELGLEYSA